MKKNFISCGLQSNKYGYRSSFKFK